MPLELTNQPPYYTIETNTPKVYIAKLSQDGTSAPTAQILKNTLGGTVVWTRTGTGIYTGTLAGAFPNTTTIIPPFLGNFNDNSIFIPISDYSGIIGYYNISAAGTDTLNIETFTNTFTLADIDTLFGGSNASILINATIY